MRRLFGLELTKLWHLSSLRVTVLLLVVFPLVWAYAPGVFDTYGFYMVSAYQVPALSLLSSMEFLLPLLIAIASAELLGLEVAFGTLPTVLLRPVTRSRWLIAKLGVVALYPFLLLGFLLLVSLLIGLPFGYGAFVGGTGLGAAGLLGEGLMTPGAALAELSRAYLTAACALIPISVLSILFTVVFMNAAGGALATLSVLIVMKLLVVFPGLEPFLLTTQLSAYTAPVAGALWVFALLALYSALFAAAAVVMFERRDF